MENVYPKLKEYLREQHGLEFQVSDTAHCRKPLLKHARIKIYFQRFVSILFLVFSHLHAYCKSSQILSQCRCPDRRLSSELRHLMCFLELQLWAWDLEDISV